MIETRRSGATTIGSLIDNDFLRRVQKSAIGYGLVLAVPIAFKFGMAAGAAWMAGIAWSLANLAATGSVIRKVVTLEPRDRASIVKSLVIKFPVLYAIGFGLLVLNLPVYGILAGFVWPLMVAVLKAAGRGYLRLDDTTDASRQGSTRVLS